MYRKASSVEDLVRYKEFSMIPPAPVMTLHEASELG